MYVNGRVINKIYELYILNLTTQFENHMDKSCILLFLDANKSELTNLEVTVLTD